MMHFKNISFKFFYKKKTEVITISNESNPIYTEVITNDKALHLSLSHHLSTIKGRSYNRLRTC